MKNETLNKIIEQIKKYNLSSSFSDVENFKKWVSELNDTQINNFLSFDMDLEKNYKHLLINLDLLNCEDYKQKLAAILTLKNVGYEIDDACNSVFLESENFYKDIELLRKADTGEALWLLREKTFIDSPYHEEDLKLFVEATTKLTKHAIATVASSADSIKSPYHQEDMKMIATANSNCLSNGLNTGNGMDKLAINKVSLADKYHSENMRILSKNPKNKNYLCELMTNPDIVNGENYRKEIDALLNAKSSTTGKALYCYISNPNEKISYMGYPMIEKNSVAGNNDSDYLNNLIKINEMDDRFVVDFAILLMNPNFINSQYKKFDLELLQNVDRKVVFATLCKLMKNEKSLNSSHHKKDAVIISQAQEEVTCEWLLLKATDEISLNCDDHDYDMEYISKLKNINEIESEIYMYYYLFTENGMKAPQRKEKLEKLFQGASIEEINPVLDYLDILQRQINNASSPIIESVSDVSSKATPVSSNPQISSKPKSKILSLFKKKNTRK